MGVGPLATGPRRLATPPAGRRRRGVTGLPLELARPLMESLESDLLPRDLGVAERLFDPDRGASTAPSSAPSPNGSRSSPWPPDEGRARQSHRGPARRRVYDILKDPDRLGGLGHDPPAARRRAEQSRYREGVQAHPVPAAGRQEVQRQLAGGGEQAVRARGVGGARAGRVSRLAWNIASTQMATAPSSPTSTSTTCRGAAGPRRGPRRLACYPKGSGRFLATAKTVSRVNR